MFTAHNKLYKFTAIIDYNKFQSLDSTRDVLINILTMMHRLSSGKLTQVKHIKFLYVGAINTIVGYCIFAALSFLEFNYLLALLSATIIGVIFNYFNFGKFVFPGHRDWRVFCKFIFVYLAIYAVNAIGLWLLTKNLLLNPYVGQFVCMPPCVLLTWLLMNYWVFKK